MAASSRKKSGGIFAFLFPPVLAAVVAVAGSYLAFKVDIKQADVDLVRTFSEKSEKAQEKLFSAQMRILKLELELGSKYGEQEAVKDYLESLPYPAWIKKSEENPKDPDRPRIKMWYINTAYENFFKVKRDYYIGKTDFDVWPIAVAQAFYDNDLHVLSRASSRCEPEAFPSKIFEKTKVIEGFVCKGAFKFKGERAVSGQALIIGDKVKNI